MHSSNFTQLAEKTFINWDKTVDRSQFEKVFEGYHEFQGNKVPCLIKTIKKFSREKNQKNEQYELSMQIAKKMILSVKEYREFNNQRMVFPLVEVYSYGESNTKDSMWIALQKCVHSFSDFKLFQNDQRLSLNESFSYIGELAFGLKMIHEQQLIHYNLKSSNIYLSLENNTWHAYIGVIGFIIEEHNPKAQICQKNYAPPEAITQIQQQRSSSNSQLNHNKEEEILYTSKMNIWQLGAIFHELLIGKQLIIGSREQQIFQNILKFGSYKEKWRKSQSHKQNINNSIQILTEEQKDFLHYYQYWSQIDFEPIIDLIDKMLHQDPQLRLNADQVYQEWQAIMNNGQFQKACIKDIEKQIESNKEKIKKLQEELIKIEEIEKRKNEKKAQNKQQKQQNDEGMQVENTNMTQENVSQQSLQPSQYQFQKFSEELPIQTLNNQVLMCSSNTQKLKEQRSANPDEKIKTEIQKDEDIEKTIIQIFGCTSFLFEINFQLVKAFSRYQQEDNQTRIQFRVLFQNFFRIHKLQLENNQNQAQITTGIKQIYNEYEQINPKLEEFQLINSNSIQEMNSFYLVLNRVKYPPLYSILMKFKDRQKEINKKPQIILEKLIILLQIANSLKQLRINSIFHGNLSIKNIYIKNDKTVELGFHTSDEFKMNNYQNHRFEMAFKSPELIQMKHLEKGIQLLFSNDLWSLGVLTHYIFTLKHLFQTNFKIKDIILNTRFKYLSIWKELQKYQQEKILYPQRPLVQKYEAMGEILNEIPNEQVAELINIMLSENKNENTIDEIIARISNLIENEKKNIETNKMNEETQNYSIFE